MEPGESSMACYQNAAVICIVIKLEPPLRLPPSFLLYLCSCLFLCIMFFSLDPISIIEIIPLLFSLPLETLLSSPFFASIFRFPCWLCHYHFGVVAHLLCGFFFLFPLVFSLLCSCLCCVTTKSVILWQRRWFVFACDVHVCACCNLSEWHAVHKRKAMMSSQCVWDSICTSLYDTPLGKACLNIHPQHRIT